MRIIPEDGTDGQNLGVWLINYKSILNYMPDKI